MRNLNESEVMEISGGIDMLSVGIYAAVGGFVGGGIGGLVGLVSTFTYYNVPMPKDNGLGYVCFITGITHAWALACALNGLIIGAEIGIGAGIIFALV